MRLYLCGTISAGDTASPDTREANIALFYEAEQRLVAAGYGVLNPARRGHSNWDWLDYMRAALRDIADSDGIALLPGWEQSKGASIERDLASAMGLPVKMVDEWVR